MVSSHDRLGIIDPAGVAKRLNADGYGVVWGLIGTGIHGAHPHFQRYQNLDLPAPVRHRDFTRAFAENVEGASPEAGTDADSLAEEALFDPRGYGTHVAAIVAGVSNIADTSVDWDLAESLEGVAPRCKLLSLKVVDDDGAGDERALFEALRYVDSLNREAGRLVVHGVSIFLSLTWDYANYACGASPICQAVNALIDTGVIVVAAAGNDGQKGSSTITDPGNAERVVTVGSTHRRFPQLYGPSYFSSRGPTADGRPKPDLLAPGERILSAVAPDGSHRPKKLGARKSSKRAAVARPLASYELRDGTSIATAFVSGAVAAVLAVKPELIGRPADVKKLLLDSATDLGRDRYFQGHGLLCLSRALDPHAEAHPAERRVQKVADVVASATPPSLEPAALGAASALDGARAGKRFSVAFSLAGEQSAYVEGVVKALRRQGGLPRNSIFFYKKFEAEVSRIDMDTYLQGIYKNDAELLVICISAEYVSKEWTALEWRVVRDVIKRRDAKEIILIRFDDTPIEGMLSIDGYISAVGRKPDELAELILDRLDDNREAHR